MKQKKKKSSPLLPALGVGLLAAAGVWALKRRAGTGERASAAPGDATQLRRIERYEKLMDEATALLDAGTLDGTLVEKMEHLSEYYGSDFWKRDFADDEAGRLPQDLKRGVLSEDGLWNLMERYREALADAE